MRIDEGFEIESGRTFLTLVLGHDLRGRLARNSVGERLLIGKEARHLDRAIEIGESDRGRLRPRGRVELFRSRGRQGKYEQRGGKAKAADIHPDEALQADRSRSPPPSARGETGGARVTRNCRASAPQRQRKFAGANVSARAQYYTAKRPWRRRGALSAALAAKGGGRTRDDRKIAARLFSRVTAPTPSTPGLAFCRAANLTEVQAAKRLWL